MQHSLFIIVCIIGLLSGLAAAKAQEAMPPLMEGADCDRCPMLVKIPPGEFMMGDLANDGRKTELPPRLVTLDEAFFIGKFEVTFDQWDACFEAGGCEHKPSDGNWGRGARPVGNVNWFDAKEYVNWLSARTGKAYRLPTEAEWEYAARAGTSTRYPWGDDFKEGMAVCLTCGTGHGASYEVGQMPPNEFGLYDMVGLQREWVEDCWVSSLTNTSTDGSANTGNDCAMRVIRGGAWYDSKRYLRSAFRMGVTAVERTELHGFRVVREE